MASIAMEPENVGAEPYTEKAEEARGPAVKEQIPTALADVVLRFLLFASGLVAAVVMVTSNETQAVAQIQVPPFLLYKTAKFSQSPAFIYYVAAVSVAGLYGLITTLISFFALLKPAKRTTLVFRFIVFDTVLLGIVASAIGAAGGVAYVGLMGNKEVQWNKICNLYTHFCIRGGASIAVSLFGSSILILLILLSLRSLSRKIPKHS